MKQIVFNIAGFVAVVALLCMAMADAIHGYWLQTVMEVACGVLGMWNWVKL